MNESTNPLGGAVWRRGARLGLVWLAAFAVVTVALYAGLGWLGWTGAQRALCAMGLGPVVGSILIAGWWLVRRPDWGATNAAPPEDVEP